MACYSSHRRPSCVEPARARSAGMCAATPAHAPTRTCAACVTTDAEARFSTYVVGLTDGVTVWALSIAASAVRAIQWPFFPPFEPDFGSRSFGTWAGNEFGNVVRVCVGRGGAAYTPAFFAAVWRVASSRTGEMCVEVCACACACA